MISISHQKWDEQYGMVRRLVAKAHDPWKQCIQLVNNNGYRLNDSWGRPEIMSQHYRVRLTCDYPDARRVVVSLYPIQWRTHIKEHTCSDLLEGVKLAIQWLNQLERRRNK